MQAIRNVISQNPAVGYGSILLTLLLAAYLWAGPGDDHQPGRGVTEEWYYDLASGALSAAPIDQFSPLPDGRVRAYVYGCDCTDPTQRTIAYLERYTEPLLSKLRASQPVSANEALAGTEYREEKGDWTPATNEQAMRRIHGYELSCPGGAQPTRCFPGG